jgi:hypothetical protein
VKAAGYVDAFSGEFFANVVCAVNCSGVKVGDEIGAV